MKHKILYCLLSLFVLSACEDESLYENPNPGEGESNVTLCMSFHPSTSVSLGGTRATNGDAIKEIENLFIILFDENGNLYDDNGKQTGLYYYIENPTTKQVDRNENCPDDKNPTTELKTVQAKCECRIPYGKYRIYAVANMGNLAANEYSAQILKEADFKKIRFKWSTDVAQNAQMSGYFTANNQEYARDNAGDYVRDAQELVIDKDVTSLHAWLRRAASKVTVDYDATKLREGVTIYLKSVTLKNIPSSCSLVDVNQPTGGNVTVLGTQMKDLIDDGEGIVYESRPELQSDRKYVLAKGHPHIDGHEDIHNNDAPAMFFYENMQGKGEEGTVTDKRQNVGKGNSIAYPDGTDEKHKTDPAKSEGWRDGKESGTYVEVQAYYISNAQGNVGRGSIVYRFMLGKDIITDYNAERNYHYKLTLKFNGNANDVDWHIEYKEEDAPGVYMPDYYVSYSYNQPYVNYETDPDSYWEKCYPIRLAGSTIGDEIAVRIIENNWGPSGDAKDLASLEYYTGTVRTSRASTSDYYRLSSALGRTGVWHGFLSLYRQEGQAEISGTTSRPWTRYDAGEYIYWYNRGQKPTNLRTKAPLSQDEEYNFGEGYRTYKTTLDGNSKVGEKVYVDLNNGSYKVIKSIKNGLYETTVYIPLFTRPLVINQKKGFSGNNPYFSFQRQAKLQINATINDREITQKSTINQVRRIVNPRGIFRSWDNDSEFKVTLMYRTSEAPGTDFVSFPSEGGPWRATIVAGNGWNINGGNQATGGTNSTISFTVAPNGKLANSAQTACALVRVEYHDYHCVHYIHLRQGYAPLSLDQDGVANKTYWHSFNIKYTDNGQAYESNCELDEGSMFRYGNLTQAIDAINNTYDDKFTPAAHYGDGASFILAPIETASSTQKYAKWADIKPQGTFSTTQFTVDGVTCRMPRYADYNKLKVTTNAELDVSLGLCYGDEATANSVDDEIAFSYSWYARKGVPSWFTYKPALSGRDPHGQGGVRGCFVYNHDNGNVIFLPLGDSSFGRRKGSNNGILRYGDLDVDFPSLVGATNASYVPCLYNLYKQYGAVYWVSDQTDIGANEGAVVGWDINYSSIDFNPIYQQNLWHSKTSTADADAALIRLVQDSEPTIEQCDEIDKRIKAYQGKTSQ